MYVILTIYSFSEELYLPKPRICLPTTEWGCTSHTVTCFRSKYIRAVKQSPIRWPNAPESWRKRVFLSRSSISFSKQIINTISLLRSTKSELMIGKGIFEWKSKKSFISFTNMKAQLNHKKKEIFWRETKLLKILQYVCAVVNQRTTVFSLVLGFPTKTRCWKLRMFKMKGPKIL